MVYDLSMRSVLGGFEQYDSLREELFVLNSQALFWELLFSQKKT